MSKFLHAWINFAEEHPFIYWGGVITLFGLWISYLSGYIGW